MQLRKEDGVEGIGTARGATRVRDEGPSERLSGVWNLRVMRVLRKVFKCRNDRNDKNDRYVALKSIDSTEIREFL